MDNKNLFLVTLLILTLFVGVSQCGLIAQEKWNPEVNNAKQVSISVPATAKTHAFTFHGKLVGWMHRCRRQYLNGRPCVTEIFLTPKELAKEYRAAVANALSGGKTPDELAPVEELPGLYAKQPISSMSPAQRIEYYGDPSKDLPRPQDREALAQFLAQNIPSYTNSEVISSEEQPLASRNSRWSRHYRETDGDAPFPTIISDDISGPEIEDNVELSQGAK